MSALIDDIGGALVFLAILALMILQIGAGA